MNDATLMVASVLSQAAHAASEKRLLTPKEWPWFFDLWVAFVFVVNFGKPVWGWIQRKRAESWPEVFALIESAEVVKSSASFFGKRRTIRAELLYSYSIAGVTHSGQFTRYIPTDHEAEEFVRGLRGKHATIHYNQSSPAKSALLPSDLETMIAQRAPIPAFYRVVRAVPGWLRPILLPFALLAAIGLGLSLWVHIGALFGRKVAPESFFWILHLGIFLVWIPSMIVAQKLVGDVGRKDFWKAVLMGSPAWVRYVILGFAGYAVLNFLLFLSHAPSSAGSGDPPAAVWRGFSGHWMAFYSAALAILYTAAQSETPESRCPNGHLVSSNALRCAECGQTASPTALQR